MTYERLNIHLTLQLSSAYNKLKIFLTVQQIKDSSTTTSQHLKPKGISATRQQYQLFL